MIAEANSEPVLRNVQHMWLVLCWNRNAAAIPLACTCRDGAMFPTAGRVKLAGGRVFHRR
jgi:hypothetical protein